MKKAGLVRNKKINLITFIPSILWRRKQKLIENCKEAQKQDINLRYQVRLGSKDIELWTKHVGENYFQKTPLFAFGDLPDIEKRNFYLSRRGTFKVQIEKGTDLNLLRCHQKKVEWLVILTF